MNDPTSLPNFDRLWDYSKPAETEAAFRAVLEQVGAEAPEAYRAELQTQIARTFSLRRQFDESHAILDEVEAMPAAASGRARARYLMERGRTFNSSGQKAAALPLFEEAWNVARDAGEDGLAVDAAHMVAIAEDATAALQWNLTALELATMSADPAARKWRKSLHNNIGWTFFDLGKLDQALFHFEKCQECAVENNDKEAQRIARWSIAKTYRVMGKVHTALNMQYRQLSDLEAIGADPGFANEEIAECLLALGKNDEAAPYFAKAYASLSQDRWLVADEPARLERLKKLAGDSLPEA